MTRLPASFEQVERIEERNNRIHKARQIADAVWPHVAAIAGVAPETARQAIRNLPDHVRHDAAVVAGTRDPSPHTWAIVANLIAHRVEHAGDADVDPFLGLPR